MPTVRTYRAAPREQEEDDSVWISVQTAGHVNSCARMVFAVFLARVNSVLLSPCLSPAFRCPPRSSVAGHAPALPDMGAIAANDGAEGGM